MLVREMTPNDIPSVLPLYVAYYNHHEDGCWTEETAGRRIHQVVCMEGGYSLILEDEERVIGFAMGFFKQYDDLIGYTLEEILIASSCRNKGIGSWFLGELEQRVRKKGASLIELLAVNDDMHEHFYEKAAYHKATSLIPRTKWLT